VWCCWQGGSGGRGLRRSRSGTSDPGPRSSSPRHSRTQSAAGGRARSAGWIDRKARGGGRFGSQDDVMFGARLLKRPFVIVNRTIILSFLWERASLIGQEPNFARQGSMPARFRMMTSQARCLVITEDKSWQPFFLTVKKTEPPDPTS
jgi:hypothetical protein